jgi:hypothetical protein
MCVCTAAVTVTLLPESSDTHSAIYRNHLIRCLMPRSESKSDYDASQEEKDCKGEARAVPVVSLLSLDVSPNHCGVSEVTYYLGHVQAAAVSNMMLRHRSVGCLQLWRILR